MKTLIISDIHNRVHTVEQYLMLHGHEYDEIVFAGDYFDSFHDSPFEAGITACWLRDSIQGISPSSNKPRIHLLGNHDVYYRFPHSEYLWCPGYTPDKGRRIRDIVPGKCWEATKLCYYTQGWLISHAGVHKTVFSHPINGVTIEGIQDQCERALIAAKEGRYSEVLGSGWRMANTRQTYGGIIWLDWDHEFEPVEGLNQIVGHTPGTMVRAKHDKTSSNKNYCIDTNLMLFGVIEDGNFSYVKSGKPNLTEK